MDALAHDDLADACAHVSMRALTDHPDQLVDVNRGRQGRLTTP